MSSVVVDVVNCVCLQIRVWKTNVAHQVSYDALLSFLFVQQTRFSDMGDSIMGRMDDMGSRMDDLEQSE